MLIARHTRRIAAALTLAGVPAGCVASGASTAATPTASAAPTSATAATVPARCAAARTSPGPSAAAADRLTCVARRRYAVEVNGGVAINTARRLGRDPALLRTLQSGSTAATRAYVRRQFPAVWYHWHVSRMRIVKGSATVVETGVPFVVAPSRVTLRASGGRSLGALEVSIQDVIGFVRLMHRNYPVDVVVRGQGATHVRSSLPAAAHANLPSRGAVRIAGRRYVVRSFQQKAWGGEPVTVWILKKA
jgi:hypothetical protein